MIAKIIVTWVMVTVNLARNGNASALEIATTLGPIAIATVRLAQWLVYRRDNACQLIG